MPALRILILIFLVVRPSEIMFTLPMEDLSLSWSFYYRNVLLMKGDTASPDNEAELKVDNTPQGTLLITLAHPGAPPESSKLIVRTESGYVYEYQYEVPQSVDAFTPTVETGSHFIIPVDEIISSVTSGDRSRVDFYYLDDGQLEQHLGTIVFLIA